jgi:hypothetical protein
VRIKPFNVIEYTALPEITVEKLPVNGDPMEIEKEMYFVCESNMEMRDGHMVGVIPLIVKNPANIKNIENYIKCLSVAHRRVQFRKANRICDFNECDEMVIS